MPTMRLLVCENLASAKFDSSLDDAISRRTLAPGLCVLARSNRNSDRNPEDQIIGPIGPIRPMNFLPHTSSNAIQPCRQCNDQLTTDRSSRRCCIRQTRYKRQTLTSTVLSMTRIDRRRIWVCQVASLSFHKACSPSAVEETHFTSRTINVLTVAMGITNRLGTVRTNGAGGIGVGNDSLGFLAASDIT